MLIVAHTGRIRSPRMRRSHVATPLGWHQRRIGLGRSPFERQQRALAIEAARVTGE